jgi:hypothetical protein
MPFKSEAQRRYLYSQEPEIAERWTRDYGSSSKKKKKGSSLLSAYDAGAKRLAQRKNTA